MPPMVGVQKRARLKMRPGGSRQSVIDLKSRPQRRLSFANRAKFSVGHWPKVRSWGEPDDGGHDVNEPTAVIGRVRGTERYGIFARCVYSGLMPANLTT